MRRRSDELVRLRAMRRTSFAAALALAALALVAVGCESPEDASPTPETVEGELPRRRAEECSVPSCDLEGDAEQGKQIFAASGCGGCHTLSDAGASGTVGPNLDDAKPSYELAVTRVTKGAGRDAVLREPAVGAADRGRRAVRRRLDRRLTLQLPPDFPVARRRVRLRPRPHADRRGRRAAAAHARRDRKQLGARGIRVIVATGRMFQRRAPYLEQAGLDDPVVCYQGAAVVDPRDRGVPAARAARARPRARGDRISLDEAGHPPNCYVGDELFVAEQTAYSRAYAEFQHIPVTEVGDLLGWLDRAADEARRGGRAGRARARFAAPLARTARAGRASSRPHCRSCSRSATRRSRRAPARRGWRNASASPPSGRSRSATERTISSCSSLERLRHRGRERSPTAARAGGLGLSRPRERGRRHGDRGVRRLTAVIDLKAARAEPEPLACRHSPARAPRTSSTRCSRPTSAGGRSCRASTSFAAGRS